MILQSSFLGWTPCFSQPWPGFSFPRIALPFHDRVTNAGKKGSGGKKGRGGSSGSAGPRGADGQRGADGEDATDGTVEWRCVDESNGVIQNGGDRFNAALEKFRVADANADGVFEPGETCEVSGVEFVNDGGLDLPEGVLVQVWSPDGSASLESSPIVLEPVEVLRNT